MLGHLDLKEHPLMGCLSSALTTRGVDVSGESWGCTATTFFPPKSQVTQL